MRRPLAVAALVFAASISNAQAAVIMFEDVPLSPMGTALDPISGGFFFDTEFNHSHIDNGTWGTTNGSQFMMIDNVAPYSGPATNNFTTFSPVGGGPFAFTSIDISEAAGNGTSARQIEVTGHLMGGGTLFRLLDLDDNFDETVTANYFQTFVFDPSWTNLSSVVLNGVGGSCCGPTPGNYYAIDNINVELLAVPEPGTLGLLALGFTVLTGRRRTRR